MLYFMKEIVSEWKSVMWLLKAVKDNKLLNAWLMFPLFKSHRESCGIFFWVLVWFCNLSSRPSINYKALADKNVIGAFADIWVRICAKRKIGCVPVGQPKTCNHSTEECVWEALGGRNGEAEGRKGYPWPIGTSPRQLSGPIVAQEVERHRDSPKFCVRVIFDIYLCWFWFISVHVIVWVPRATRRIQNRNHHDKVINSNE